MPDPKPIRVVATDLETGESGTQDVKPGNYVVICAEPAYVYPFVAVTREKLRAWQSELADARRLRGEVTHELVRLRSECASQAAEIEQLRADLERANFAREKLAQTIAACPEGHHDANLAHTRAERDRLRAEVAQYEGGTWVNEYGAVNDMTGEFVPFSWLNIDNPDAAIEYARIVGKPPMRRRVWRGKPEPIPATEAEDA